MFIHVTYVCIMHASTYTHTHTHTHTHTNSTHFYAYGKLLGLKHTGKEEKILYIHTKAQQLNAHAHALSRYQKTSHLFLKRAPKTSFIFQNRQQQLKHCIETNVLTTFYKFINNSIKRNFTKPIRITAPYSFAKYSSREHKE